MAFSLAVGSTCSSRRSKTSKFYNRYATSFGALEMDRGLGTGISISRFLKWFKVGHWIILRNKSTNTGDFPSRECNFCWISTFLLKDHQNISRWLEPRPWYMVPGPYKNYIDSLLPIIPIFFYKKNGSHQQIKYHEERCLERSYGTTVKQH